MMLLDSLITRGFDQSYREERDDCGRFTRAVRVRCSQCEAAVINGLACHETGCPNGRRADRDMEDDWQDDGD